MRTVLLVDDDPVVLVLLTALLQAEGWQVAEASSLADAEQALQAAAPDVVVLDEQLPDGRGTALAARLADLAPRAHVVLHSGGRSAGLPPGVHAVVPKAASGALLDHLAVHRLRDRGAGDQARDQARD